MSTDPLPANAAYWRRTPTDVGTVWTDLNAPGTGKFSDADFPAFKGWNCFDDEPSPDNQRGDSIELKRLIRDHEAPESIRERDALARRLGMAKLGKNSSVRSANSPAGGTCLTQVVDEINKVS